MPLPTSLGRLGAFFLTFWKDIFASRKHFSTFVSLRTIFWFRFECTPSPARYAFSLRCDFDLTAVARRWHFCVASLSFRSHPDPALRANSTQYYSESETRAIQSYYEPNSISLRISSFCFIFGLLHGPLCIIQWRFKRSEIFWVSQEHDTNLNRTQDISFLLLCTLGWLRLLVGFAGGAWRFRASCPPLSANQKDLEKTKKTKKKLRPLLVMLLFTVACLYIEPAGGGLREPWNDGPRPPLPGHNLFVVFFSAFCFVWVS